MNHNDQPLKVIKNEKSGIKFFNFIKSFPKKEDDILSLELLGSALSVIVNNPNKTDKQKVAHIRLMLVQHRIYKY